MSEVASGSIACSSLWRDALSDCHAKCKHAKLRSSVQMRPNGAMQVHVPNYRSIMNPKSIELCQHLLGLLIVDMTKPPAVVMRKRRNHQRWRCVKRLHHPM